MGPLAPLDIQDALERHLRWWGLRRFTSDAEYFAWQWRLLSPEQVARLHHLVEARQRTRAITDDVAFYDASADPRILPILYSQRYDYFLSVGRAIAERVGEARRVLDLGCGPGILTTFLAGCFPDRTFLGLDRSRPCIELAGQRAAMLGLANLEFACADLTDWQPDRPYDLILSAQVLLQTEHDPGLPSGTWRTFDRPEDPAAQRAFERRTGLADRLDRLRAWLVPAGRLILFEKTGHLARRVPFQRALAARGFVLREPPTPIRYALVEEVNEREALYTLGLAGAGEPTSGPTWCEAPLIESRDELYALRGGAAAGIWARLPGKEVERRLGPERLAAGGAIELGIAADALAYLYVRGATDASSRLLVGGPLAGRTLEERLERVQEGGGPVLDILDEGDLEDPQQTPLYENHGPSAQRVWEALPDRQVIREATATEPDGRQVHLEYGAAGPLAFVYCANTFDQRQLVVMDLPRRHLLETYYAELVAANRSALGPGSP